MLWHIPVATLVSHRGRGAPATPLHPPAAPAHLGSPIRLCGTQPHTRMCTPSLCQAGSVLVPHICVCHRGMGSPGGSRHHLRAKVGVSGGKGLGDTGSRERPFPFLSAIGITTVPQHPHPTQGPVAVSPSATTTAVPTSMPGVIQLG